MALVLGIDTGGTYTDTVVFDLSTQKVVAKAKSLTTHGHLVDGICHSIKGLPFKDFQAINMVSLSTTLATNAVVEGRGCEAGVLLIGKKLEEKLPVKHLAVLQGGHKTNGQPQDNLDIEEIYMALSGFRGKVDAIAVSGYFSIRNPEHELQVRELIDEVLGVPVVCAHQLSTELGFKERTITALLNAKLIPVIGSLISSVKFALKEYNIEAQLMIVKGDGTLMSEEMALEKPIDTILSGPAASIVGAAVLTGIEKGLVLDMGGTTTDIAILEAGQARISKDGAAIGGWLTRVKAAEIYTYGLGGDSYIQITNDGELVIGPQRVMPLAQAAYQYPGLHGELREMANGPRTIFSTQPTDCFILLKNEFPEWISETELTVLEILEQKPHTLFTLAKILGKDPNLISLQRLVNSGIVAKASVTPTDLLEAKGSFTGWNREAAKLGVEILAQLCNKSPEEFLDLALDMVVNDLAMAVLESTFIYEGNRFNLKGLPELSSFLNRIISPCPNEAVSYSAQLNVPVIALGAPVQAYLPKVAKKLNARLIIPEYSEVANALGAAVGKVVERIEVLIRADHGGGYILHSPWEYRVFGELEEAKQYATEQVQRQVMLTAKKAGAMDCETMLRVKDETVNSSARNSKSLYLGTRIEAVAVGRPKWVRNSEGIDGKHEK